MSQWEPCGHVPPLPPIDLHAVRKSEPMTDYERLTFNYEEGLRRIEGDRVWKLVVEACQADG